MERRAFLALLGLGTIASSPLRERSRPGKYQWWVS